MLDDLQSLACCFLHVDLFFFGFMRCNPKLRDWPNLHMRIHATWVFDLVQFSVFSGCAFFVLHYTRLKLLGVKISGRELFFLICLFPLWNARLGQFTCEIIKTGNDFPDFVVFVGHFIFGVKISGWENFFSWLGNYFFSFVLFKSEMRDWDNLHMRFQGLEMIFPTLLFLSGILFWIVLCNRKMRDWGNLHMRFLRAEMILSTWSFFSGNYFSLVLCNP